MAVTRHASTLQLWGNSLAVRIPADIARAAGFTVGQPVKVAVKDHVVQVTALGEPRLNLRQKLALYDPHRHGGEAMLTSPVGEEF